MLGKTCQKCSSRAPLTHCISGSLCRQCGSKCHPHYQHPVHFISHSQPTLTHTKTIHSIQSNSKNPPKRITKVSSSRTMMTNILTPHLNLNIKQTKESSTRGRKSSICSGHQKSHQTSVTTIKESRRSRRVSQLEVRSIAINTEGMSSREEKSCGKCEENTKELRQRIQRQEEIMVLLKKKLLKQKEENKKLKNNYQHMLRQIRNLRS